MTTTPQTITNLGTGGTDLNAVNGSTSGADSNDSKFLDWPGDNAGSYIYTSGVSGNYLSVPDDAAYDVPAAGILTLTWYGALDDYTPAAITHLVSKFGAAGQRSFNLNVNTTGTLRMQWSTDGTATTTATSTATISATDGNPIWLRGVLDTDDAGIYTVKFYTSADGVTFTQLGTTVSGAATTSVFSGTNVVNFMSDGAGTGSLAAGAIYEASIDINGVVVLRVDTSVITSGAATSFTAVTAPATGGASTVTINRGTAGRKTVAVVSPVHLFGSDDYWEIADNALLDFSASDSFTVLAVVRQWGTQTGAGGIVVKRSQNTAGSVGWSLVADNGGTRASLLRIDDGSALPVSVSPAVTDGAVAVLSAVRSVSSDQLTSYTNSSAGTPVTDTTTATLANTMPVRVGRWSSVTTNYMAMELLAVAVFRRALSATEIASITTYYQARLS